MKRTMPCLLILAFLLCFVMIACEPNSSKELWTEVLKRCAASDLLGRDVLYLGPSNNVGPGAIFRAKKDGGYALTYLLKHLSHDTDSEKLINTGSLATCKGKTVKTSKFGAGVALESDLSPITGEIGTDFNSAKSISVSVESWHWDDLFEGVYVEAVDDLADGSRYKQALYEDDSRVLTRALKVHGLVATLQFDKTTAIELKPKYGGPLGKLGAGDVSLNVSAEWVSATTLRITSETDFYLAGELSVYSEGGFAGVESRFTQASVMPGAQVTNKLPVE